MKIVIIGSGLIAASHAQAISEIKDVQLVAVCDVVPALAEKLASMYSCSAYHNAEEMLNAENPQVAIICLPTFIHEEYVRLCAKKGINVLCEKPLERSVDACQRLVDIVNESKIIFMTAQVVRFWSGYVEIKDMIKRGELGEIYMMHLRRVSSCSGQYGKWLFEPQLGGGALWDMLVHDVDYLRYVAGPFESCFANATKDKTGCYNNVMANIIHKNGIHAVAETSFTMQTGYPFSFSMDIVGSEATVSYNYCAGTTIAERSESTMDLRIWRKNSGLEEQNLLEYDAYKKQMEYFLDCVKKNTMPEIITPTQSFEVIQMIDALNRSADTGEIVKI